MQNLAIKASGLTRKFGTNTAVDHIDLAIKHGEIYGFLGPNGAGKSTTIRMLVTLLAPTNGNAWIMGHSIVNDVTKVRLGIGVALQDVALDDQQTGAEILRLQGRLYGLSTDEVDSRLKHLRELIDIGDALDRRIKTYSGGMKRRLDLAAALVHNPKVLFLDEPTTGLDPVSRMRVWDEIRALNKKLHMTIFLTTQYLEEADQLADRIGIISKGKIAAEGTPKELKRKVGQDLIVITTQNNVKDVIVQLRSIVKDAKIDAHGQEITIGCADGSKIIGSVAATLYQSGVTLEQLTLRTPSLDDVFIDVTGNRMQKNNQGEKS